MFRSIKHYQNSLQNIPWQAAGNITKIKISLMALPFRKQFFRACLLALIVISSLSVLKALISYDDATSIYLSFSLKSPKEGIAALYYDVGKGYNAGDVHTAFIRRNGQVYDYLFKIPNKTLYNLRWDPPPATYDPISIRKIEILDGSHSVLKHLDLRQLEPLYQIQALEVSDEKAELRVQEGANDPQVKIRLESPFNANRVYPLFKFLGGALLEFTGFFLVTCLLAYLWLRGRNKAVTTIILVSLVIFGFRCWTLYDDAVSLFVQVNMRSSLDSTAQVYYDLKGSGMSEKQSFSVRTTGGDGFRRYRFKIPNKLIYEIRFDPLTAGGKVRIGEIKITDAFGRILREIDVRQIKPKNQISAIDYFTDGLEVSVAEGFDDPQLVLPLEGSLNFEGKLPFPMLRWLLAVMTELVFFALCAFVFITVWGKWGRWFLGGLDSPFVQEKLPLIYMGTASGLILAMGFISGLDVHPDEWGAHMKAAAYYIDHWLPAAVDDPRIVNSISSYGVSNLWHIEPIYFFAAKTTHLLSGIVSDFYLKLRLFNAFLFLSLVLVIFAQIKRSKWVVLFLVVTPQLWYVFSYFNNDAFPWFIAMLVAMQVVDPESSLNRFLSAPAMRRHIGGGVLAGILLGLLISSKLNYKLFVAFLIFAVTWKLLFETAASERRLQLKKWIFVGILATLVYLPIFGYDQYVNDFNKTEKAMGVMERYAETRFKLSTIRNDLSSSYKGLRLRDKGTSFQELFLQQTDWRDMSFKSFFGVYGYMDLFSDRDYYRALTYALGAFFLVVFFYVAFTLPFRDVVFFLFVCLFAGLAVGQSVYHSWTNDFQPQGRYLFLILPIFLVGLARLPVSFRTRIIPLFGLIFFSLSVWSFVLTGLKLIPKIN